jgi:hypothetical protein
LFGQERSAASLVDQMVTRCRFEVAELSCIGDLGTADLLGHLQSISTVS